MKRIKLLIEIIKGSSKAKAIATILGVLVISSSVFIGISAYNNYTEDKEIQINSIEDEKVYIDLKNEELEEKENKLEELNNTDVESLSDEEKAALEEEKKKLEEEIKQDKEDIKKVETIYENNIANNNSSSGNSASKPNTKPSGDSTSKPNTKPSGDSTSKPNTKPGDDTNTNPVEPEKPIKPERPVEPEKPIEPEIPVEPEKPIEPEKPVKRLTGKELKAKYYNEIGYGKGPYRGKYGYLIDNIAYKLASNQISRSQAEQELAKLTFNEPNERLGTTMVGISSYEIYEQQFNTDDVNDISYEVAHTTSSYNTIEFYENAGGYRAISIGVLFYEK